jgi:hypothetical protein
MKPKNPEMTYALAMAAGQDAANRVMRAEGRTVWNEDDYAIAAELTDKILRRWRIAHGVQPTDVN